MPPDVAANVTCKTNVADIPTLAELLFHAEQFCLRVESGIADAAPNPEEDDELRLKIGQCRSVLSVLQEAFENDVLTIENASVRSNVRVLVMSLMWVAFYGRHCIDFRKFRMLVMIESTFTHLLMQNSRPR